MSKFVGKVVTEWVGNDRDQKLIEEFLFIDNDNNIWRSCKYSVINGASIPKIFWVFIGSPFVGKYRRASVIHDTACEQQIYPHNKVHKMFYDAMICDGVTSFKAMLMYKTVAWFGPKW